MSDHMNVYDLSGQPVDMLPYLIGGLWPHTSSPGNESGTLDSVHDPARRVVSFVKWENPACRETYRYDYQYIYLHEDRTDELAAGGRNAWHLTDGRWCRRAMRPGDGIDAVDNWIERYGPDGIKTSEAPFPYRMTLMTHYAQYSFGGDVGDRECVVLKYDPTWSNPNREGAYELFFYARDIGWVRWESRDAHGDTLRSVADMVWMASRRVTPDPLIVPLPGEHGVIPPTPPVEPPVIVPVGVPLPTGVDIVYPVAGVDTPILRPSGMCHLVTFRDPTLTDRQYRIDLVDGSVHVTIDTPQGRQLARSARRRFVSLQG